MRKIILFWMISTIMLAFVFGCGTKLDLPTGTDSGGNLGGAGDTTYIRLSSWSAAENAEWYDFDQPRDIVYGWDESMYVADTGNNRIMKFSKTGFYFSDDVLVLPDTIGFANPTAITQDVMLNIYAVNGGNKIMVYFPFSQFGGEDYLHVYEGPADAQYVGIVSDGTAQKFCYVTDQNRNEMVKLRLFASDFSRVYELTDPTGDYVDSLHIVRVIAEYGSGATTLDDPRQIAIDDDGHLYFTQTCATNGVFHVQAMYFDGVTLNYVPTLFSQFGDVTDRELFLNPNDVAARGQGAVKHVYVLDTGHNLLRTYKFKDNQLQFQKPLLAEDGSTLFDHPMGVAIAPFDDEKEFVIYIADTNNNRIERYWLSVPSH